MNLHSLRIVCVDAFCSICHEQYEELNNTAKLDMTTTQEFIEAIKTQTHSTGLFERGRRVLFCRHCKCSVHSNCFKPRKTSPQSIELPNNDILTFDCFECDRCLFPNIDHTCSLCDINEGITLNISLISSDRDTPDHSFDKSNTRLNMTKCHVLCGLHQGGVYLNRNSIELSVDCIGRVVEGECSLCHRRLKHRGIKCVECGLHTHMMCLFEHNRRDLNSRKLNSFIVEETGSHSPPSSPVDLRLTELSDQLSNSVPLPNWSTIFGQTVEKHLSSYQNAISRTHSISFRCSRHLPLPSPRVLCQRCRNCGHWSAFSDSSDEKDVCDKCQTLKRLSQFETESDFDRNRDRLTRLDPSQLGFYDWIMLGKTFYDRLVFITPPQHHSILRMDGFKVIRGELVDSLMDQFTDGLFQQLKREIVEVSLQSGDTRHSVDQIMLSLDLFARKVDDSPLKQDPKWSPRLTQLGEFIDAFSLQMHKWTDPQRSFLKTLKTLSGMTSMKELRRSVSEAHLKSIGGEIESMLDRLKSTLADDLSSGDSPIEVYLGLRSQIRGLVVERTPFMDSTPLFNPLVIRLLGEVESFADVEGGLRAVKGPNIDYSRLVLTHIDSKNFETNIDRLKNESLFVEQNASIDRTNSTDCQRIIRLATFESECSFLLKYLNKAASLPIGLLDTLRSNGLLITTRSLSDFMSLNKEYSSTHSFVQLKEILVHSVKCNSVIKDRMDSLTRVLSSSQLFLTTQIKSMVRLVDESLTQLARDYSFIDDSVLDRRNQLASFKWFVKCMEGRRPTRVKMAKSLTQLSRLRETGSGSEEFSLWLTRVTQECTSVIANEVIPQIDREEDSLRDFRQCVTEVLFTDNEDVEDVNTADIDYLSGKHLVGCNDGRLVECPLLTGVKTLVDSIKRALQLHKSTENYGLMELLSRLANTPKWSDRLRKSNRTEKISRIVDLLAMSSFRRPNVDQLFRCCLKHTIERKLEEILADSLLNTSKIEEFLRLTEMCTDDALKSKSKEYKFMQLYTEMIQSVDGLLRDPLSQFYLGMAVQPDQLSRLIELGFHQSPIEGGPLQSLESVGFFCKRLSGVLDLMRKFETSGRLFSLFEFLSAWFHRLSSLKVLWRTFGDHPQNTTQDTPKTPSVAHSLDQCIGEVEEIQSTANNPQIESLLQRSRLFRETLGVTRNTIDKFDSRQSRAEGLVPLSQLVHLRSLLRDRQSVCSREYAEVKKRMSHVAEFERRLTEETSAFRVKCEGMIDTEHKRRESQLRDYFMGRQSVDDTPSGLTRELKTAYLEIKRAYESKSFTSDSVETLLGKYRSMLELSRVLSGRKTPLQLRRFLSDVHRSLFEGSQSLLGLVDQLDRLSRLLSGVLDDDVEVDRPLVESFRSLSLLSPVGSIVSDQQNEDRKLRGLFALRYLLFDHPHSSVKMRSTLLKTSLHAVLVSGLRVSETLSSEATEEASVELRLKGLLGQRPLSPPNSLFGVSFVHLYCTKLSFESTGCEQMSREYLNQLEQLMSIRFRFTDSSILKESQLSTGTVLLCFGVNSLSPSKIAKLKNLSERTSLTRLSLISQLRGFGHLHPLNLSIHSLIDFNEQSSPLDDGFPHPSFERTRSVSVDSSVMSYPQSFKLSLTDPHKRDKREFDDVANSMGDWSAFDLIDEMMLNSTRLVMTLGLRVGLLNRTLSLRVRDLKWMANEVNSLANWIRTSHSMEDVDSTLARRLLEWLKECWETIRLMAEESLRPHTQDESSDRNATLKNRLSEDAPDLIRQMSSTTPFDGLPIQPSMVDPSMIFEIQNALFRHNQTRLDLFIGDLEDRMASIEVDWRRSIADEVGRLRDDVEQSVDRGANIPNDLISVESEHRVSQSVDVDAESSESDKSKRESGVIGLTEEDVVIENSGPTTHGERFGTLGVFFGKESMWKSLMKAVRRNKRFDKTTSQQELTRFVKRLESNWESLRFLYHEVREDRVESFLEEFRDVNRLIDQFNRNRMGFQEVVQLMDAPHKRLKSSKAKGPLDRKQPKTNLINEIYEDLGSATKGTDTKPTDSLSTHPSTPSLTKRDNMLVESDKALTDTYPLKRTKEDKSDPFGGPPLLRLTDPSSEKILFIDDRGEGDQKTSFPNVSLLTCESESTVSSFPQLVKSLRFKTSEFKKKWSDLQGEFVRRSENDPRLMVCFCFIPVNRLPNGFYSHFESGSVGGFAPSPRLQVFLAHSSSLNHDFFQSLHLWYPSSENHSMHDLFFMFFRKSDATQATDDPNEALKSVSPDPLHRVLSHARVEDGDALQSISVGQRRKDIEHEHIAYQQAYGFARFKRMTPHVYFKMGAEILKIEQNDAKQSRVVTPLLPNHPVYSPFPANVLPSNLESRLFSWLGYTPLGMGSGGPVGPVEENMAESNREGLVFQFEDANGGNKVSLLPIDDKKEEETEEIESLIKDLSLDDLVDYFREADEDLKGIIKRAMKKSRSDDYHTFEKMIEQRMNE